MPKLRVFSGVELCNFLSEHGFERVRQRGSEREDRTGKVGNAAAYACLPEILPAAQHVLQAL